jgi:3-deoxy-D-manno-octulosonic-acid transferase
VFVGGSLVPHGGQNMLEPAAQGKAVLFGPHVENFDQEAALLLAAGRLRCRWPTRRALERELARCCADRASASAWAGPAWRPWRPSAARRS